MIFRWYLYPCWWKTVQKICPSHLVANLNLYICSVCYEAADTLYTTIEKLSDPFRLPLFNIIMMIRWHLYPSWWKTVQTICPRHLVANLKLNYIHLNSNFYFFSVKIRFFILFFLFFGAEQTLERREDWGHSSQKRR